MAFAVFAAPVADMYFSASFSPKGETAIAEAMPELIPGKTDTRNPANVPEIEEIISGKDILNFVPAHHFF